MTKKKSVKKKVSKKKTSGKKSSKKKIDLEKVPTLKLKTEHSIAMDFAIKTYKKFDKIIKAIVLFGSVSKKDTVAGSDIDIIILIDDVSISWDQELIAWYREELDKILKVNPYNSVIHINTIKLSTWWEDLLNGDPVVINVLRNGEALIDAGGFFNPLKFLLLNGKIKTTPESVYNCLKRAPMHIARSKAAELSSIEGLFWSMVDSAQAALGAANVLPPSPEHISVDLKENFVNSGKLKMKYVLWYRDLLVLHKKISHGQIKDLKGVEIDMWQERAEEFLNIMAQLVREIVG
ncbi:MAG: nucleotidyltransferase domain-containing protein [Nanoarchaeota archaeon]|nr:nucleotidyltransferase domain-containing protein [Nanoarchaeota archaeon]